MRRVEETFGGAVQDLRDRIDDLKDRIDDMHHSQSLTMTRWGIAIAGLICVVQVVITVLVTK